MFRPPVSHWLLSLILLAPQLGSADSTYFTDVPLRTKNRAKPNILMFLDNGGASYLSYSPDTFISQLQALSGINDGSNPSKLRASYYARCPVSSGCTSTLYNSNATGDDDWHFRANDCTVSGSSSEQTVSCSSASSAFNRLYFLPNFNYSAPKSVDGSSYLPLPSEVAASPSLYSSYINLSTYPNALNGCSQTNPSIDTNTSWSYDGNTLSTSSGSKGQALKAADGQSLSSYDTCAWIDGYNPQLGTVNLLRNYTVAPYPLDQSAIPAQNFPKLLSSGNPTEVVRPDGRVKTLATYADSTNYPLCASGKSQSFICAPGKKPSSSTSINCNGTLSSGTSPYNSLYRPVLNDFSAEITGSNITQSYTLWWQNSCTSPVGGGSQFGPFPLGVTYTTGNGAQNFSSPYYCDTRNVGTLNQSNPAPAVLACAKLSPSSQSIWANPGPADYFDTSGNRYPITSCSAPPCSDTSTYQIAWSKDQIRNFALWHSFYRSRLLTVKTALGTAVNNANLNSNFRVGLASVFSGDGGNTSLGASSSASQHFFSPVAEFDTNHQKEWYDRLQRSQSRSNNQGDYVSSLHSAYLWLTGTYPDPSVPSSTNSATGQPFMSQSTANTSANTGALSQYLQYQSGGSWHSINRTGPMLYSCQPNILVFISSGYTGIQNMVLPGIGGSGACTDPYIPGGSNSYSSSAAICDVDAGTVSLPGYLAPNNPYDPTVPGPGYFYDASACNSSDTGSCTGSNINYNDSHWPYPLRTPSNGDETQGPHYKDSLNTAPQSAMAQLALYYWSRDLNEEFNRQKNSSLVSIDYPKWDSSGRPSGSGKLGVPAVGNDSAFWPHVTTYMVNLGTQGRYDYLSSSSNPINNAGSSSHLDWPHPTFDPNASYQTYLDDMAHAAVAGHGRFLSAYNSSTLNQAFSALFTDILQLAGNESAVSVANLQVSSTGTSYAFQSSYNTAGWWGDLIASPIQATTGTIINYGFNSQTCQATDSSNPGWSAACQLRARLCPGYPSSTSCDGDVPGANHASSRIIVTDRGNSSTGPGISFDYATLNGLGLASQFELYGGDANAVIDYLRGSSRYENCASGASTGFRCRYKNGSTVSYWNPLGDAVDAESIVIAPPLSNYVDTGYSAWKASQVARTSVVFQAANDGMVHAFLVGNGTTGDSSRGQENWAYIPSFVLPQLKNLAAQNQSHQYRVNATPAMGDVDFNNIGITAGSADWHTLLIGGLGKGGRGYYALDITTPNVSSASEAAAKVLWTFPNSSSDTSHCSNTANNMGYSYGRPIMTKLPDATMPNGIRWVVLVASGYNNGSATGGDGKGHIYILDAKTGTCLQDLNTSAGNSSTSSGLADLAVLVTDPATDNAAQAVYGGDQLGNVWKLAPATPSLSKDISTWTLSLMAVLKDSSGRTQAVTTEPNVALINGTAVVYLGTGQYLGTRDVPSTANYKSDSNYVGQSIYALTDNGISYTTTDTRSAITTLNSSYLINGDCTDSSGNLTSTCQFGSQFCAVTSAVTRCFAPETKIALSSQTGVHPWIFDLPAGERIISTPLVVLGTLMFTSNQPLADPCQPGGKSYFYMLDYRTGGTVSGASSVSQTVLDPVTGDNVMASRPTVIQLPDGRTIGLVATTAGSTLQVQNIASQPARRVAWREVNN